jgi:hypothetical protein
VSTPARTWSHLLLQCLSSHLPLFPPSSPSSIISIFSHRISKLRLLMIWAGSKILLVCIKNSQVEQFCWYRNHFVII